MISGHVFAGQYLSPQTRTEPAQKVRSYAVTCKDNLVGTYVQSVPNTLPPFFLNSTGFEAGHGP